MNERTIRSFFCCAGLLFVVLASAMPLAAQPAARGLPRSTIEKVERAISTEMSRQKIPGLSAAIVAKHQLQWSNGYGMADLENFVPAKSATVYRLASISKPITATAVMQLAERGKLDLDAPIQKYVPSFPQKPWPITARQLLGHLSGVRHYKDEAEFTSTRHYTNILETLNIFKDDPLLFEPGTKYLYTTYGYSLLGAAVESASGMKYVDYVRENIFGPAGMDRIRPDDVYEILPNRAQGYRKMPSGELRNSPLADTSSKIPGGGFCSTVEDLARFAIAVQTDALVKRETLERMFTPQKTRDGKLASDAGDGRSTGYGLGWTIAVRKDHKEVWHGGAQPRVSTMLYMLPDEGVAVVLMSNLEGASLVGLARQISDMLLE
jgi:CubicO group peptidase (beta-lactamase class C family)